MIKRPKERPSSAIRRGPKQKKFEERRVDDANDQREARANGPQVPRRAMVAADDANASLPGAIIALCDAIGRQNVLTERMLDTAGRQNQCSEAMLLALDRQFESAERVISVLDRLESTTREGVEAQRALCVELSGLRELRADKSNGHDHDDKLSDDRG